MQRNQALPKIYAIILIEGFVTVSLEILSIRQLIPFVGNSVTVTSLIIGTFLLFLAQGYQAGGKVKAHYKERLIYNFLAAGVILGFGFSYPLMDVFFQVCHIIFGDHLLLSLTLFLLCIVAPSVFLLGQTIPITMHLSDNGSSAGTIGGKVLHLSTLGSFLGAVLTSLICMRYLGVAHTVFLNYVLLVLLIAMITIKRIETFHWLLIGVCLAIPVYKMNASFEKEVFIRTTNYANYRISPTSDFYGSSGKIFISNRSYSSYINHEGQGFPYIEKIKDIIKDLGLKNKRILVLGAGGFVLGYDDTQNEYTYVDIDGQLPDIIERNNFVNKINGQVVINDARQFLLKNKKPYDMIVVDAFSHTNAIPMHLTTQAFFKLVRTNLTDQGIAVYNMIIDPWLKTAYAQNIDNTLRSVYEHCLNTPITFKNQPTNNVYACTKVERSRNIYTDNYNDNDIDMFGNR